MTIYYVSSTATDNSGDGLSKVNAKKSLTENTAAGATGALAAANAEGGGPHFIYVDSAHSESLTADSTNTMTVGVNIISVDWDTLAPESGAVVGAQSTAYTLNISGAVPIFISGMRLRVGASTGSSKFLNMQITSGGALEMESCALEIAGTSTTCATVFGVASTSGRNFARLRNCTFKFANASQMIRAFCPIELIGCSLESGTTVPSALFIFTAAGAGQRVWADGCDFSLQTGFLVGDYASWGTAFLQFSNCKLGTAILSAVAAQTGTLGRHGTNVWFYNCSDDDNHYEFAFINPLGTVVSEPNIYANDGAKYDGTNGVSWKIITSEYASFYNPFVTPWIEKYAAAGSITPTLELLRDNSSGAVYQTDEVWSDFSYQGNSGSTKSTVSAVGRMTPLGSGADQTSSSITWTGATGTPGKFKLSPGSVTVNEIGHLRARVCVGEPSITVYVDPTIRT
jgi:hypothetical protein